MSLDVRLESFRQQVQFLSDTTSYEVRTFPNNTPIVVVKDTPAIVYTQNGEAIGFGAAYIAPGPPAGVLLLGPPQESCFLMDDGYRWTTQWSYVYTRTSAYTLVERMAFSQWPTSPTFQVP